MASIGTVKKIGLMVLFVFLCDMVAGLLLIDRQQQNISLRTFHPYYHHGLIENRHSIEPWTYTKKYEMFTNSLGFRDNYERQVQLQITGKYRIVFIGDSFTEGVGVNFDDTFVGILDRRFGSTHEVLDAGVISYGATTYYLKIKYLLENIGLKFDALYVFSDISDVYNDYQMNILDTFTPQLTTSIYTRIVQSLDRVMNDYSYIWHNFKIIYPYVRLRKYEKGFPWWTVKDEVYNDWGRKGLEMSGKYMQRLVDLCKEKSIRVTIVVYPWTNLIEERDLNSRQVTFWKEFTDRNHIGFINLFPSFINETPANVIVEKYFMPNDIHWNKAGHALIAEVVANYMETNGKADNAAGIRSAGAAHHR